MEFLWPDSSGSMSYPKPETMKVWVIKYNGEITHYVLLVGSKADVEVAGILLNKSYEGVTVEEQEIPYEQYEDLIAQSSKDQKDMKPKVLSFVRIPKVDTKVNFGLFKPGHYLNNIQADPAAILMKVMEKHFSNRPKSKIIIVTGDDFDGSGKGS